MYDIDPHCIIRAHKVLPADHGYEGVAGNIVDMARHGYSRDPFKRALGLAQRRPLTTGRVEDLHGATSCTMRHHPLFKLASCKARSFLSFTRTLVCPATDQMRLRLENKLTNAMNRMPSKINAKCMYLADCIESTIKLLPSASKATNKQVVSAVVKRHAEEYLELSDADKRMYRDAATKKKLLRKLELAEQIQEHKSNLELYNSRKSIEHELEKEIFRSSNFRFGPEQLQKLSYIMSSGSITTKKIEAEEHRMNSENVEECSNELMERLDEVRLKLGSPTPLADVSDWVRDVCRRTGSFRGTILEFNYPNGQSLYFAVMVPFQIPHEMCLQPLTRLKPSLQCVYVLSIL